MKLEELVNEKGTKFQIASFLGGILSIGTILGLLLPKNDDLNGVYYPFLSSILGYSYFSSWSISFYPQVLLNKRRKSTIGLSVDFSLLNVIGYICYTIYTSAFYYNSSIREEYRDRHRGTENTVEPSDVAFAWHALVLSSVTMGQIVYYNPERRPSSWTVGIAVCIAVIAFIAVISVESSSSMMWLDVCYLLSSIKVFITISKYIPQAWMNFQRKSTSGWNIWNVICDLTGGLLSFIQLFLDSWNLRDWSGVYGNPAKLGISLVSIIFDLLFLAQHYCLYPNSFHLIETEFEEDEKDSPLLFEQFQR